MNCWPSCNSTNRWAVAGKSREETMAHATATFTDAKGFTGGSPNVSGLEADQLYLEPNQL